MATKQLNIRDRTYLFALLSRQDVIFNDGRVNFDYKKLTNIWGKLERIRPSVYGMDGYASAKGYTHKVSLDNIDGLVFTSYAYLFDKGFSKLYKINEIYEEGRIADLYISLERSIIEDSPVLKTELGRFETR